MQVGMPTRKFSPKVRSGGDVLPPARKGEGPRQGGPRVRRIRRRRPRDHPQGPQLHLASLRRRRQALQVWFFRQINHHNPSLSISLSLFLPVKDEWAPVKVEFVVSFPKPWMFRSSLVGLTETNFARHLRTSESKVVETVCISIYVLPGRIFVAVLRARLHFPQRFHLTVCLLTVPYKTVASSLPCWQLLHPRISFPSSTVAFTQLRSLEESSGHPKSRVILQKWNRIVFKKIERSWEIFNGRGLVVKDHIRREGVHLEKSCLLSKLHREGFLRQLQIPSLSEGKEAGNGWSGITPTFNEQCIQ